MVRMGLLTAILVGFVCTAEAGKAPDIRNVGDVGLEVPDEPFTFGPGDKLTVAVFHHPELNAEIVVAPDGTITYPLVGQMTVAGQTYTQVLTQIQDALREYYTDASVAVNIREVTNQKVIVAGEVQKQQTMQITGELRVLEALVQAGGINPDARTNNVLLIRGGLDKAELYTIDVDRLLNGDLSQNVLLQKGDVLVVPTKTIVNVERFFRHVQGILSPFVNATQIYRNVGSVSSGPASAPTGN
jgi:polysaccharide export outer membrane protein